jgi:hypothetical protein
VPDAAKSKTETAPKSASSEPQDYSDKLLGAIQYALGALGAVAATALGKIAFDQLSDGVYTESRCILTFVCAIAFGLGVVAFVSSVIAATTQSSVSFSWLRQARQPKGKWETFWRWLNRTFFGRDPFLAFEIVSSLTESQYLVPGARGDSGPDILKSFGDELATLIEGQYRDPAGFAQDANAIDQLTILIGARATLLKVAKRARLQQVSQQIPTRFFLASILVVFGAVGFGYATSQAKRAAAAADLAAQQVVTGDLLPKVPTTVRVLFPADAPDHADQQTLLSADGKSSCDLDSVNGVLVGISFQTPSASGVTVPAGSGLAGSGPAGSGASGGGSTTTTTVPSPAVMHVFTFATDTCNAVELWLPPERVILPPAVDAATPADAATTTTTPVTSTTG